MKKGIILSFIFLCSCGPRIYNRSIIKVPRTEENLKIIRECQSSIATALPYNADGVKYRCYSTLKKDDKKMVKFVCSSGVGFCLALFKMYHVPQGCSFLDSESSDYVMYLVCDPDVVIPDEIVVK